MTTSAFKTRIKTDSADSNALMLFDNGELVAILVELADEAHGDACGSWVIETTFGLNPARRSGLFSTAKEAAAWVSEQICHKPFILNRGLMQVG